MSLKDKLKKASIRYSESTFWKTIVNAFPWVGGSLDVLFSSKGQKEIYKMIVGNPFGNLIDEISKKRSFFPSLEEFEKNYVYFPKIIFLDSINKLNSNNQFLILGEGASGKTVFSFVLGMHYIQNEKNEVLYLDFKENNSDVILLSVCRFLEINGNSNQLVILDNIHLCQKLNYIYPQIKNSQIKNKFKVLYVGRKTKFTLPDSDNDTFLQKYSENGGQNIILQPRPAMFYLVFKRFQKKYSLNVDGKNQDYDTFREIFGNDLFMFSFAIESQKEDFDFKNLDPYKGKVALEIEKRYFKPVEEDKQQLNRFIDLCGFCSLDLSAPKKLFEPLTTPYENPFIKYREQGIIYEYDKLRYNLVHSSLGHLIFNYHCQKCSINPLERLSNIIKKVPELISQIVENLSNQNKYSKRAVFKTLFEDNNFLKKLLESKILLSTEQIFIINKYFNKFQPNYLKVLRENFDLFSNCFVNTDLHSIRNYLSYLQKDHKTINKLLESLIQNKGIIINKCKSTAPHWLMDFLVNLKSYSKKEYVQDESRRRLASLYEEILNRITDNNDKASILNSLINGSYSLEYVRSFLSYIQSNKREFHNLVIGELLKPSLRNKLISRGISNPLNHFTNFLDYVYKLKLFNPEDLISDLEQKDKFLVLKDRLFEVPFDISFNFIKYWNKPDWKIGQDFSQKLVKEMFDIQNKHKIIRIVSNSNLIHVVNCFEFMKENGVSIDYLSPEILNDDIISPIFDKFSKLQFPQIDKMINRLNDCGGICTNLSQKFIKLLLNNSAISEQFRKSQIIDKIKTLEFLDKCGEEGKDLSIQFLMDLKKKKYFEKLLTNELKDYTIKPRNIKYGNRISTLSVLTYWINYISIDLQYFATIISRMKEYEQVIINLLLSEDIDKVGDFLRKLDNKKNEGATVWSHHLRKELIKENNLSILMKNALSKSINYLTSVMEYHDKNDYTNDKERWFSEIIITQLSNQWFNDLINICSRTLPYQLIPFFRYLDKQTNIPTNLNSKNIFNKIPKDKQDNFIKYLKEKQPDYLKSFLFRSK